MAKAGPWKYNGTTVRVRAEGEGGVAVIGSIEPPARRGGGCAAVMTALALSWAVACTVAFVSAQAPAQASASMLSAAGPLSAGRDYTGRLEAQSDSDFYYFYVTSTRPTQVVLTVENLGGGTNFSRISATITDRSATPVGAYAYSVGREESGTASATLGPQKYFVEVAPHESFGDTYRLTSAGSNGAFGAYATVARRCAQATAAAAAARNKLARTRAKLQRVTARLRRSRYGTRRARTNARAAHRRAKSRMAANRRRLRAGRRARSPWCFIPE